MLLCFATFLLTHLFCFISFIDSLRCSLSTCDLPVPFWPCTYPCSLFLSWLLFPAFSTLFSWFASWPSGLFDLFNLEIKILLCRAVVFPFTNGIYQTIIPGLYRLDLSCSLLVAGPLPSFFVFNVKICHPALSQTLFLIVFGFVPCGTFSGWISFAQNNGLSPSPFSSFLLSPWFLP